MDKGHPVTKAELETILFAALSAQKNEIQAALRSEFQTALSAQKKEVQAALTAQRKEVQAALTAQKDELTETMRQIETNLLTEFHRYAKGQQARMHTLEGGHSDIILRLATIEDRLLALESRRPPTV